MSHDSRYETECPHGHGWYFYEDGCAVAGCENAPAVGGVPERAPRPDGPFWWRWPSWSVELLSGILWAALLWPWPTAARIPLIVIGAVAYELWLDRNGWSWEDVIYRLAGVYLLEVVRLMVRT